MRSLRHAIRLLGCILLLTACQSAGKPDAYGIVDARSWMIASPEAGQIAALDIAEGAQVAPGTRAAQIDTLHLVLQRQALEAQISALKPAARSDNSAERVYARTNLASLEAQARIFNERIARCAVCCPESGTVAAIYAHEHEFVAAGQPIFKLADLSRMYVEAWIDGSHLAGLAPGAEVRVRVDAPDGGLKDYPGRISYIADEAQFTPGKVMTRSARTQLVYQIRIDLAGNGCLKAGMPAEIFLSPAP